MSIKQTLQMICGTSGIKMKTSISIYKAALITSVAVFASSVLTATILDLKATSEDSHMVLNVIKEKNLPVDWEVKFNAINSNWPPSRNKLANLLLDAEVASFRKTVEGGVADAANRLTVK
jgi:predicted small integral membrane protein